MAGIRKHPSQVGEKSLKKNASRYKARLNEPKPVALLGSAPKHLDAEQKRIWEEIVERVPEGILFACDAYVVELTVRLTQKMRDGKLSASETGQYRGCLASLGITPADRSRVKAPPAPPEKSKLDRILDGDDEGDDQVPKPN